MQRPKIAFSRPDCTDQDRLIISRVHLDHKMHERRSTMLLVWIVLFTFHHASAANVFCGNDHSVVIYPDKVVNVSCWCNDSTTFLLLDGGVRVRNSEEAKEYQNERNITVMIYEGDDVKSFNVSVIVTKFSNGTSFKCVTGICEGGDCIESLDTYIYSADGPPSPPQAPSYLVLNSTILNIFWSAPWSLPVDNYTIRMFNSSSSTILNQWTTQETSVLVSKTWNSDCDLINITVEANTGVGSTGQSQQSIAGFPSCLKVDEVDFFVVNVTLINSTGIINIYIKIPSICSYETIDFTIITNNTNTSELMMSMPGKINNSETQLTIPIEGIETKPGDVLQVILTLFNIDSQTFQIYASDFIVVHDEPISTTSSSIVISSTPIIGYHESSIAITTGSTTDNSGTPTMEGQQVEFILFVVGVSGAVIGLMFCLIACTILGMAVLLFYKSKQMKQRSLRLWGNEELEMTNSKGKSNPQDASSYDPLSRSHKMYPATPFSTDAPTSRASDQ